MGSGASSQRAEIRNGLHQMYVKCAVNSVAFELEAVKSALNGASPNVLDLALQLEAAAAKLRSSYAMPVRLRTSGGMKFFQRVKDNLSHEDFNKFATLIKLLDEKVQTPEQLLEEACGIFGERHKDLHFQFGDLLYGEWGDETDDFKINVVPLEVWRMTGDLLTTVKWYPLLRLSTLQDIVAKAASVSPTSIKLFWNSADKTLLTEDEHLFERHSDARASRTPVALTVVVQEAPPPPPVDGKSFFRQARQALSHEDFNRFLACIKRLNNQQETREATLEQARGIFGDNNNLYTDFEVLLNQGQS